MAIEQRVVSRDDLIERLQEVAAKLGRQTVARADFIRETGVSEWQVLKHFDSWNEFVEAAGLQPHVANRRLGDDELFAALRDAYLDAGGVVPRVRLRKLLRHGDSVYTKRLGRWDAVLVRFHEWLAENDPDFPFVNDLLRPTRDDGAHEADSLTGTRPQPWTAPATRTRYGPFLNFRGLQHAPINEQGVVFLFGMVAFDLGYVVEGVGVGFPDCEAKRCVDKSGDVWERVRIEFEYKSRNFLDHGHRNEDCDVLVCWEHNWPDCPIEVVELRSAIDALGE